MGFPNWQQRRSMMPDALDVVVLAEDEAGERLPSVLPQNPDAAREAAGGLESRNRGDHPPDRLVVGAAVEIVLPERRRGVRFDQNFLPLLPDDRPVRSGSPQKGAVLLLTPAESLTAAEGLGKAESGQAQPQRGRRGKLLHRKSPPDGI